MNWIEISIKTTGEAVEAIADMLTGFGANGVAIVDPADIIIKDDQSIVWDYIDENLTNSDDSVHIKAYYPDNQTVNQTIENIKSSIENIKNFLDVGECLIEIKTVCDQDWENEWKKYYKPLRVGNRILIKPTWESAEISENDIVVELDPGMAFGTGTHESTRMCIELLENYVSKGNTLLDVGCGSGILSIISAKLGCSRVLGIDLDPVAVKVAEENISVNNVEHVVTAKKAVIEDLEVQAFDVVVANIIADVIINISEKVKQFLVDEGVFIVSGIIKDRANQVRTKFSEEGLEIIQEINQGEWVAMAAKKYVLS